MAAENSMMLTERTDELLNRGRSQGFISTEEVADLVQEGDLSTAEIEEFYAALEEEEITLVEGEAPEASGEATRRPRPSRTTRLRRSRSPTPSPPATPSGCTLRR
jgi:RNA polymerase primary sigma factor